MENDFRNFNRSPRQDAIDRINFEIETKYTEEKSCAEDFSGPPNYTTFSYATSKADQKRMIEADERQQHLFKILNDLTAQYVYGNGKREEMLRAYEEWKKAFEELHSIRSRNG